jgi:ferredoxin-NADP reductase
MDRAARGRRERHAPDAYPRQALENRRILLANLLGWLTAGYDERGLISADWLARETPKEDATYYLCGLRPFLRAMVGGLARTGVPPARIRYEFFGPADELLAA